MLREWIMCLLEFHFALIYCCRLQPELQKVLHTMKMAIENSSNPPKCTIPNSGLLNKLCLTKFYTCCWTFWLNFDCGCDNRGARFTLPALFLFAIYEVVSVSYWRTHDLLNPVCYIVFLLFFLFFNITEPTPFDLTPVKPKKIRMPEQASGVYLDIFLWFTDMLH